MKNPVLKWVGPDGQHQVFQLVADELVVGRKSDADVVVADPYVSRHHAKMIRKGDAYSLLDLGSTHGTFVNGQRVTETPLKLGDRISLGRSKIEILYTTESGVSPGEQDITFERSVEQSLMNLTAVLPSAYSEYSDLEKLSFLLDFQYAFGRNFSDQGTFEQILASALKISGAERGFLLLRNNNNWEYAAGLDGEGRSLSQSEFRASQTAVRKVSESGQPVFMTEGLAGDLAQQASIVAMNLRALSCMPLRWIESDSDQPQTRGILYLDSTKVMHALSGLDQKILNKLGVEAANAFEKVAMIKTLEERRIIEQELALARETQQSLLPAALPELPEYTVLAFSQPTRHVGGDFYDFPQTDSHALTGVLADVSGKGISAALLSSLLQGALDMTLRSNNDYAGALNLVNRFLCQRSQANRFVTLFLFYVDKEGRGGYISAGHNPAYLYRAATGEVEELFSGSMILGAFSFATYASAPLNLSLGDVLLVYSDGLTEAENRRGEMFGEERLINLIKEVAPSGAENLEGRILAAIEDFTEGRAQTDDITLVIAQRNALVS